MKQYGYRDINPDAPDIPLMERLNRSHIARFLILLIATITLMITLLFIGTRYSLQIIVITLAPFILIAFLVALIWDISKVRD